MNKLARHTLLCAAFALLLAGCGSEPTKPADPAPLSAGEPIYDVVPRLVAAYEHGDSSAYARLFTGDFTYEFSNQTDPTLVQQYSGGWLRADEVASAGHLFHGLTKPGQETLPGASAIRITFAVTTPTDDNTTGIDPMTHKVLATRVDGQVTIPPTELRPDPTDYVVENNYNVLYLVRGDVAVGLDAKTQPADANHWYVYRWVDLTGTPSPADGPVPTQTSTWGRLKAIYR